MRVLVYTVGTVVFVAGNFLVFAQGDSFQDLNFMGKDFPAASFIFTALLMLSGILLGALFRNIYGREEPVQIGTEIRTLLRSSSFIAALCISPYLYLSVYLAISRSPSDPASYLLAFENGFFCEAIIERVVSKRKKDGGRQED